MSLKGGLGRGLGGASKLGAGRGIGALIPGAPVRAAAVEVPRHLIDPDPAQPRQRFDEEALQELAASLKVHGVIQPIVVRAVEGGRYQIIAGERRWRASALAGLDLVPIVCREVSSEEAFELAILENIQRQDLTPLEEARSYARLMSERGYTQEQVAERTGKSRAAISNAVRLLKLSEAEQLAVEEGRLSAGHARALLSLSDSSARAELASLIEAEGMSVRQAEAWAKAYKAPTPLLPEILPVETTCPPPPQLKPTSPLTGTAPSGDALSSNTDSPSDASREATPYTPLSDRLKDAQPSVRAQLLKELEASLCEELKRPVKLKERLTTNGEGQSGGQLTLSFGDDEDLTRLVEYLLRRW